MIIAKSRQLAAADAGECPGVEDDHRWSTAQSTRRHQLAVLVAGRKARSRLAERETHRRVPLGRTSLVAAQSDDTCTLLVSARPAVTAASARSAAST